MGNIFRPSRRFARQFDWCVNCNPDEDSAKLENCYDLPEHIRLVTYEHMTESGGVTRNWVGFSYYFIAVYIRIFFNALKGGNCHSRAPRVNLSESNFLLSSRQI